MVLNENCKVDDIMCKSGDVVPSIIYCSPEVLNTQKWRNMLTSSNFK